MLSMTFGDVTSVLDAIPGVNTITTYIEDKAKTGAQAAIPDIQAQVQTAVLPYILIALVLGAGGLFLAVKANKKSAASLSGRRYRR